jgi:two-component system, OmpR family, heavy metal sensor histidine kinase CusS
VRPTLKVGSFRTRVALLSLLVSGGALLAFAVPVWILIGRIDLQRIDDEVRDRALRHMGWFSDNRHWEMLENELRYTYGASSSTSACLLVKSRGDRAVFQSEAWPKHLGLDRFPQPGTGESGMRLREPPPPDGPPSPGSPGELTPPPPPPPSYGRGQDGRHPARLRQPDTYTWHDGLQSWRIAVLGNEFFTVAIAVNLAMHDQYMLTNALALLTALPLAALLAAGGGWLLSGRVMRPVRTITELAESVTAQGLDQRLPTQAEDAEFARLIKVFNGMLERLEGSFQQATRFSADAAHELKTPLAILQGELEEAIQEAPVGSRQQQVYGDLLSEVQRLKGIIRKLLLLSLADSGRLELSLHPMNLTLALEALCEDTEVLGNGLTVTSEVEPDVWVQADGELLGQVLHNLATNAVKYNRPGGSIRYALRRRTDVAQLSVINTGPAIPPEEIRRVFQRFYRASKSRDRAVEGVGLGLSLAREIARAHGGELALVSSTRDATTFVLTLPASAPPVSDPPASDPSS